LSPCNKDMLNVCNRRGSDKRVYGHIYGFYAKRLNDGVSFRAFYALILQIDQINLY